MMYNTPAEFGAHDYLMPVDPGKIAACKTETIPKGPYPCDQIVFDLACLLMEENNLQMPKDANAAINLYMTLRQLFLANL
jgi:hypothetical protein